MNNGTFSRASGSLLSSPLYSSPLFSPLFRRVAWKPRFVAIPRDRTRAGEKEGEREERGRNGEGDFAPRRRSVVPFSGGTVNGTINLRTAAT